MKFITLNYIRYARGAVANSIITFFMAYVPVVLIIRVVIIVMILLNPVSCSSRNFYLQLRRSHYFQNLRFIHDNRLLEALGNQGFRKQD